MKPIEGAESEGAFGFFKGVGKGLVGYEFFFLCFLFWLIKFLRSAVTKPVVGVFDLASNVSEGVFAESGHFFFALYSFYQGIRNTTTVFDNPDRDRVRLVSKADPREIVLCLMYIPG